MPIKFISNQLNLEDKPMYTVSECLQWCMSKEVIAVDTETSGLDFITQNVTMLQLGDEVTQWVIDTRSVDVSILEPVFSSHHILKVFHNASFDYKFLKKTFNFTTENVYDTMLTEQVIHGGKFGVRYGLSYLMKRYFDIDMSKEERKSFVNQGSAPFTQSQIVYGAKDVEYLIKIKKRQEKIFIGQEFEKTVHLENDAVLAFADIEYNGMSLDTEMWLGVAEDAKKEYRKQAIVLDNFILSDGRFSNFVADTVQGDLFIPVSNIRSVTVKWTSPKQVLEVMRVLVPELDSVGVDVLHAHKASNPFIVEYLKYKKIQKRVTSYGEDFIKKYLRADGKIHTRFKQILDTGRVSSSGPNMQQIPGTNLYRNCFITGHEDWVFVSSDYASQELCVIAVKSQDPVWLEVLRKGEDLHSTAAELVYGKKWKDAALPNCKYYISHQKCDCPKHKELRTGVKSINFGLAYGMSAFKLANDLQIPVEQAEALITSYFEAFPAIKAFLEVLGDHGTKHGFIKTFPPYFRRRYFSDHEEAIELKRSSDWKSKKEGDLILGKIERASKNMPIQGSSADMTKRALILIRKFLRENPNYPAKLVMTVHDQVDTICKKSVAENWVEIVNNCMEEAAKEVLPSGLLKADTNISIRWEK